MMKSFLEYLQESVVLAHDSSPPDIVKLGRFAKFYDAVFLTSFTQGNMYFELYYNEDKEFFVVDDTGDKCATLMTRRSFYNCLPKRTIEEAGVYINSSVRRIGLATKLYEILVLDFDYVIVGDIGHTFESRKMWSRLSSNEKLKLDVLDSVNDTIVESDIVLVMPKTQNDFDSRVWRDTKPVSEYFPVLRKRHA
jgi:hypothetical protein